MPALKGVFAGTVFTDTAQTVSELINTPSGEPISVALDITAVSGTNASIIFRIQWSVDGATWGEADPPDCFSPITGPCTVVKQFSIKAPYWRAAVTVTGDNASFTGTANAYV